MHSTKSNVILYNFSQVSELWRTSYKLTKEFAHPEFRGPLRVASTVKARLENFKVNMPLINALCTPGIKDRHWEAMSVKVRWIKKVSIVHLRCANISLPTLSIQSNEMLCKSEA